MASKSLVQQLVDLQNRINELSEKGRLDELTRTEVALLCYALGSLTGELLKESSPDLPGAAPDPEKALESLGVMRRAAKKAGFRT